ncbi:Ig domain protein [Bacteriovorax sp. Seq25_V]|nr:Ig domain protein [Bacteriovorax sp. Seq25_V]
MPDSLTKFKEDSVKKVKEEVVETPEVVFTDSDGNTIDASTLNVPTSLSYADTIFVAGTTTFLNPSGDLNDLLPVENALTNNAANNFNPRYTITPALPSGVNLNTTTGVITATTSTPVVSSTYYVTLVYRDPNSLEDVQLGPVGVDIGVEAEIPDDFHVTFGATSATRKMGLAVDSNAAFSSASQLVSKNSGSGTINLVDGNDNIFVDVAVSSKFVIGDELDDGTAYVSTETVIEDVNFYFPTNSTVELNPGSSSATALVANNGVTFSISPALPSGLTLDTTTGFITGTVTTAQTKKTYVLSVENQSSNQTYTFGLGIIEAPEMLSLANLKILQLDDTSAFRVGSDISSSPIAPLTTFGTGIVRYKTTNYVVVEVTSNTDFIDGQFVDNAKTFVAAEAKIQEAPELISGLINVADASLFTDYNNPAPGGTSRGYIICQSGNAKATITKIDGNTIYYLQSKDTTGLTGNFEDDGAQTIFNTSSCDSNNPVSGTTTQTVISLWTPNQITTLAAAATGAGFKKGYDVISDQSASGYVSALSGSDLEIQLNTQVSFNNGDILDPTKPYNAGTAITQVASNLKLELEVGQPTIISPFRVKGDDIVYTISPALPEGLTLSSSSGVISGTPTKSYAKTAYTLTGTNIIGSQSITLHIQVYDYFQVTDATDAPSYILHKAGQANKNKKCRINKEDILGFATVQDTTIVDIDCMLDAGESDLYNLGAKLKPLIGKGMCEFISYRPYAFYNRRPSETGTATKYSTIASNSCTASSIPVNAFYTTTGLNSSATADAAFTAGSTQITDMTAESLCNTPSDDSLPNCDEGSHIVRSWTIATDPDTPTDCTYTYEDVTIDCGGNRNSCIAGALRDATSTSNIESGIKSIISPANDGYSTTTHSITAPIDNGYKTNISIANFALNNSCHSDTVSTETITYSNSWDRYKNLSSTKPISEYVDPFKGASPYYTFTCLDSAYDIKARIRLNIREFDRNFSQNENIDSIFADMMDDNTLDPFNNSYNQIDDWANTLAPNLSGCDATTTPTPSTVALTGTGSATADFFTVTGTGTLFETEIKAGETVNIGGEDVIVREVLSNNEFKTVNFIIGNHAGAALTRSGSYSFPGDDL